MSEKMKEKEIIEKFKKDFAEKVEKRYYDPETGELIFKKERKIIYAGEYGIDTEKWPDEKAKELEDGAIIVYVRDFDGAIDYFIFREATPRQKLYLEWFKENTNLNVPDPQKVSKDKAREWLNWAFEYANKKGIKVPTDILGEDVDIDELSLWAEVSSQE